MVQRGELSRLERDVARLAKGEIDGELGRYSGLLRPLAEDLGRLQEGLRTAVTEQVKSERMKSDLITNVSHAVSYTQLDVYKRQRMCSSAE